MDHFVGFDTLLRIFLGRDKTLHLFGPPDFFERVEGKLAGYTWNLVKEYDNNFLLEVNEVHPEKIMTRVYVCKDCFKPKKIASSRPFSGTLWEEPGFSVRGVLLDHKTPCLGLSLIEKISVNIIKEGLKDLGLPVGPWINRFKAAIRSGEDVEKEFPVTWEQKGGCVREKKFPLKELIDKIARISPGKKITYITDVIASAENRDKIIDFSRGSDILFIEAAFLEEDREMAQKKYHLTAQQAGELAREAGARYFETFHFSPRYKDRPEDLETEARHAYGMANLNGRPRGLKAPL